LVQQVNDTSQHGVLFDAGATSVCLPGDDGAVGVGEAQLPHRGPQVRRVCQAGNAQRAPGRARGRPVPDVHPSVIRYQCAPGCLPTSNACGPLSPAAQGLRTQCLLARALRSHAGRFTSETITLGARADSLYEVCMWP
jgi:hypothetical protein